SGSLDALSPNVMSRPPSPRGILHLSSDHVHHGLISMSGGPVPRGRWAGGRGRRHARKGEGAVVEFQDVVPHRRMVRRYDTSRPVPPEIVDRIVRNGLRAPSAGFSQGWGFLVLDDPADIARFREAVRSELDPDGWFAAQVQAPLLIIPHSNKDAYLDRYAQPDKGFTDRSDAWWPAPYWDIDT